MSFELVADPASAADLARRLRSVDRLALDCEAAGFHRYSDRLCLVQLSTNGDTWIVDPFAVDSAELLRPPLEDPAVEVIMHGADYDIRLLHRDLDIQVRGLFDTQVAAAMLGERALGLASLLESHLDVRLSKKYQRADWARRPIPDDMLEYAADDTRYLHDLADLLRNRLEATGRRSWAEEEFEDLESVRFEEDEDEDPVVRVKRARELPPREVAALREALEWRDRVARERDRAPFRIAGDDALLSAVQARPENVSELADVRGFNGGLARSEGSALIERLQHIQSLPEDRLVPYPRRSRNGGGRPPPEVEEVADRLKDVRNTTATALDIDRGTLLSNSTILDIATATPRTAEELRRVPGVKSWQVDVMGEDLLRALRP